MLFYLKKVINASNSAKYPCSPPLELELLDFDVEFLGLVGSWSQEGATSLLAGLGKYKRHCHATKPPLHSNGS